MPKKKWYVKVLSIVSIICWVAAIIPGGYVLYQAVGSMSGTIHGFNGEMLYGISAFIDTILMFIAFFFPFFLLWVLCLLAAIVSTAGVLYLKKHPR